LPRMKAHRLVIIAAALTTLVAAALATALATVSGQGLPHAIRHDLSVASGTAVTISGSVNASQAAQYNRSAARADLRRAGRHAVRFYRQLV